METDVAGFPPDGNKRGGTPIGSRRHAEMKTHFTIMAEENPLATSFEHHSQKMHNINTPELE